jgi:hypothetical protein
VDYVWNIYGDDCGIVKTDIYKAMLIVDVLAVVVVVRNHLAISSN